MEDGWKRIIRETSSQMENIANPNILLGTIGDSRLADNITIKTGGFGWSNKGILSWAMFLSNQRYYTTIESNLATAGADTSDILIQAYEFIKLDPLPKYCLVNGDTNDSPYDIELIKSNYTEIISLLRGAKVVPIIITAFPVSTSDTDKQKRRAQFNTWLRTLARDNGYYLLDAYRSLVDFSTGFYKSKYTRDGTHLNCIGAYEVSKELVDIMDAEMGCRNTDYTLADPFDIYDVTENPTGNLITNGFMDGTGGSNTGTGASGDVADDWNNRIIGGEGTSVASKEAKADGVGYYQVITLNATTDLTVRFQGASALNNVNVGDKVRGESDIYIYGTEVDYVRMNITSDDGTSTVGEVNYFEGDSTTSLPITSDSVEGRFRTSVLDVPVTSVNTRPAFYMKIGAGGSAVVKIGNTSVRKEL